MPHSAVSFYLSLPLPLPSPYSSVRARWLFKMHSSAVFPYCRSSSCMSECAVTFKGERNLEGQRAPQLPPTATTVTLHPLGLHQLDKTLLTKEGGRKCACIGGGGSTKSKSPALHSAPYKGVTLYGSELCREHPSLQLTLA